MLHCNRRPITVDFRFFDRRRRSVDAAVIGYRLWSKSGMKTTRVRCYRPYSNAFSSPSTVGISSETVGWMGTIRWMTV